MVKNENYWLHKLATLRIDRARGNPAPHKPLLLLVIMEMAEKGEITSREIPLSPDLAFRFSVFWSVVAQRRKQPPEVRLPFHHLGSSGMWQPLMADRKPSPDKKLTTMIRLDPSFYDYLSDQRFRDSRNNDPRNGIALSKNAHWQFDRGLWSLSDDYRVLVNKEKFIEEGVPGQCLADFEGRRIFLPSDPKYWPEPTYLNWHRKQHGFPS